MSLTLGMGDSHKSECIISKNLETILLELENGNLMCFLNWKTGQSTELDVLLHEMTRN